MALAPKGLPPRVSGVSIYLAFPKVAGKVSNAKNERLTIEDCCLNIRTSFFNKDKINYKISILFSLNFAMLNSASFPASWGSQGVIVYVCEKIPPLGESKTIIIK